MSSPSHCMEARPALTHARLLIPMTWELQPSSEGDKEWSPIGDGADGDVGKLGKVRDFSQRHSLIQVFGCQVLHSVSPYIYSSLKSGISFS